MFPSVYNAGLHNLRFILLGGISFPSHSVNSDFSYPSNPNLNELIMIFNWYSSFSFFSSSSIFFLNNTLKIFNSLKKLYLFSRSLLVGNWVGMSLWWVGKLALWEKKVKKNLDFDFPWCKYTHHRLFQVIRLTWLAKIF